jgi:hypothetical protein
MPKRSRKPRVEDVNEIAARIVRQSTGEPEPERFESVPPPEKNPAAVALGRLGGLKGGKARAAKLTKRRRSEIAKKAAEARWIHAKDQGKS